MMTLQEMAKQVYEKIASTLDLDINGMKVSVVVVTIGDVLHYIQKSEGMLGLSIKQHNDMKKVVHLFSNHYLLSQPIPLDPTEERRPVLEFLISII